VTASATLARLRERTSFIELGARARAAAVLDAGTFRELVGPFDRVHSPWLEVQGIVPQEDDGAVVARGRVDGRAAVIVGIESAFQGGSLGEVAGAKIACALELALRDCERGSPTCAVLLLETGGVRLQEANLGLAVVAEIHAHLLALRRHVPVVGVIAGMVGCFGGMSLAAALCSHLVVTRQARLGMNGPEVIEQEAGIAELDASDRPLVWSLIGGQQRLALGMVDALVADEPRAVAAAVREAIRRGVPSVHRSEQVALYRERLSRVDPAAPIDPEALAAAWRRGGERA
jgi:malonate decarboxylase beta subunit